MTASTPYSLTGNTYGDQLVGGGIGVVQAGWNIVNGMVRVAGNSVLQIGDILTLGMNHDSPIIQAGLDRAGCFGGWSGALGDRAACGCE